MTSLFRSTSAIQWSSHIGRSSVQNPNRCPAFDPLVFSRSLRTDFTHTRLENKHSRAKFPWSRSLVSSSLDGVHFFGATSNTRRRFVAEASFFGGEKAGRASSYSILQFFNLISDIFGLIFRLPWILWGLFRKEKSIVEEVEEDVDKAAEVVRETAKDIEEVAKGVEKVSKVVAEDAEKLEAFTDKVEATTKEIHKDIDKAFDSVETSVESVKSSELRETKATEKEKEGEGVRSPGDTTPSTVAGTNQTSSYVSSSAKARWIASDALRSFEWMRLKAGRWVDSGMVIVMVRAVVVVVVCSMVVGFVNGGLRVDEQLIMRM